MKIIIEISCDDVMDAHFIWDKEMMTKGIKNLIFKQAYSIFNNQTITALIMYKRGFTLVSGYLVQLLIYFIIHEWMTKIFLDELRIDF